MFSRKNRKEAQRIQPEQVSQQEVSEWVIQKLSEYEKSNSADRSRIQSEIVDYIYQNIERYGDVLQALREAETNSQLRSFKLSEKLITSKRIQAGLLQSEHIPELETVSYQLEMMAVLDLSTDLLRVYFQVLAQFTERALKSGRLLDQWPEIRFQATKLAVAIVNTIFEKNLPDQPASRLLQVWNQESERITDTGNLFQWLTLVGMDDSDPDFQQTASSAVEVLILLEETVLSLSPRFLSDRKEKLKNSFELLKSTIFGKGIYKKDWFISEWTTRLSAIREYKAGDSAFLIMAIPPVGNQVTEVANSLFISRQLGSFSDTDFWKSITMFPDSGQIAILGRLRNQDEGGPHPDDLRNILRYYYSEIHSDERYSEVTENMMVLLTEAFTPSVDLEEQRARVEQSRQKASGGMSTISERGDRVLFQKDRSEAERHLVEKGILGITFHQMEDGIFAYLHWFNLDVPLKINEYYQLEREYNLAEQSHLWLENLLLSYIAGIKQNLADIEPSPKQYTEGAGGRLFTGRRPFLKVLPFGQQSRQVDYSSPQHSDEEVTKFVMTHFGVSLFTLNMLFHDVQNSILDLKSENLEILLRGYEELLPAHMKMRTDAETIRNILRTAVKRTADRNYRVRYTRSGLRISPNTTAESLQKTQDRFSISLTHEARPKTAIEVKPMNFWCPEVSEELWEQEQFS